MNNDTIQLLRKQLGLSQKQFAEQLSVSKRTIAYWESGRKHPSEDALSKLAKLHALTDEPVNRDEPMNRDVSSSENVTDQNVTDENVSCNYTKSANTVRRTEASPMPLRFVVSSLRRRGFASPLRLIFAGSK